ncbi:hypothetical protein FQZ97_1019540 [compost metagenome]
MVPLAVSMAPSLREARPWGKVRLEGTGEPSPVVITVPPLTITFAPASARMPMALSPPWVVTLRLLMVTVECAALTPAE